MSSRVITNRQILLNITNMDDNSVDKSTDKSLVGADVNGGLRDVNGVKSVQAEPTLGAMADVSPSCGENTNSLNTKYESGGSGEHEREHEHELEVEVEGGQAEDGIDTVGKKRKTRRGKPKHRKLKPYSKQQISYEQRIKSRGISSRVVATKTGRHPPAPYNTTQFLMEDHSDLPDLEQKLAGAAAGESAAVQLFQKPTAPTRTRDSSFSIDSDDDYFYSSPEDEEEFLTKEFSSAYEDLHAERLGGLTKSELIQEYIQLESKVDLLTKRLRGKNFHQMEERGDGGGGTEIEIAKKLKICQQRIDDLIQQNEQLRRENDALKRGGSVASSVDSESDSDTTSNASSCSCAGSPQLAVATTGSGNSQLTIRRDVREQKLNGSCGAATIISTVRCPDPDESEDSMSSDDYEHSRKFTETTSPKPNCNGNIGSNGHATTHEVNGLPT